MNPASAFGQDRRCLGRGCLIAFISLYFYQYRPNCRLPVILSPWVIGITSLVGRRPGFLCIMPLRSYRQPPFDLVRGPVSSVAVRCRLLG